MSQHFFAGIAQHALARTTRPRDASQHLPTLYPVLRRCPSQRGDTAALYIIPLLPSPRRVGKE